MPIWLILNWKWIASGMVSAIAAAFITATIYRTTIAHMQRDQAQAALVAANTALAQFTADADAIHGAAVSFGGIQSNLDAKLRTVSKDFNAAIKAHPLPDDCKPDTFRLRSLSDAIAATNTAAGLQPVPAVPGHP